MFRIQHGLVQATQLRAVINQAKRTYWYPPQQGVTRSQEAVWFCENFCTLYTVQCTVFRDQSVLDGMLTSRIILTIHVPAISSLYWPCLLNGLLVGQTIRSLYWPLDPGSGHICSQIYQENSTFLLYTVQIDVT